MTQLSATFQAPASRWDTTIDERLGRPLAGFYGAGTINLLPAGIGVTARRHHYAVNLASGAVAAVITAIGWAIVMTRAGKAGQMDDIPVVMLFGLLAGAFLASLLLRFTAPATALVPFPQVERVRIVAGVMRVFCRNGGDLQFSSSQADAWAFLAHCAAHGVRVG